MKPSVSLVITTYNWPEALEQVLESIQHQRPWGTSLEVIIADDGSTQETRNLIEAWRKRLSCPLIHVWQPDNGFQAARIRNLAVKQAQNQYIIFIDGDCILSPQFLNRHMVLAEKKWFVSGNRVLLSQKFSQAVLKYKMSLCHFGFKDWLNAWHQTFTNKLWPNLYISNHCFRKLYKKRWTGAKTCNLGMWRDDFLTVKGFDEGFQGWGFEDSDLIVRLINNGTYHKNGRLAVPVYHLWHPDASRDNQEANLAFLHQTIAKSRVQPQSSIFCLDGFGHDTQNI
tara:strand:+ start:10542 stop:11390 length:849 start_codon:yes stop_codon:yes gene_type:complete